MASPKVDYSKAARILIDAVELGPTKAAEKWKVSERTIGNYRARLESDPELAEAFRKLSAAAKAFWDKERAQAEIGWRRECHVALRSMLEAQRRLVERAVALAMIEDDPRVVAKLLAEVSKAVERILQGEIASEALGVGAGNSEPGAAAAANAGGTTDAGGLEGAD